MKIQGNSLDHFLVLRTFACLIVLTSHYYPPRNSIIYQDYDLSLLILTPGIAAVWFFFPLSGSLMGKAFFSGRYTIDRLGFLSFSLNPALIIFPLYYFSVLILTLFVYPEYLKIKNWGFIIKMCTFTYDFGATLLVVLGLI